MKTSEARTYLVNIPSLKNGDHEFNFEINDAFFGHFENSLVEKGNGHCRMELKKNDTMMTMNFEFDTEVELVCDRSLDTFTFAIEEKHELIVKFGEHDEELSEDLLVIARDTQIFDTAPYLLEFINLAIPMKKLHPRYDGVETPDLIYQSEVTEEESEEGIDPRWAVLKKLSNK
jgi:uncharacterized protein